MNINMFRGDTQVLILTVLQDNIPVNISGSTIWMTAKRSVDDPDSSAVFQLVTPTDITLTDPINGVAQIVIPASATQPLTIEKNTTISLVYDVQIKTITDIVSTIDVGNIIIRPDITRIS